MNGNTDFLKWDTYFACVAAFDFFHEKWEDYSKITNYMVEVASEVGINPGEMVEKVMDRHKSNPLTFTETIDLIKKEAVS